MTALNSRAMIIMRLVLFRVSACLPSPHWLTCSRLNSLFSFVMMIFSGSQSYGHVYLLVGVTFTYCYRYLYLFQVPLQILIVTNRTPTMKKQKDIKHVHNTIIKKKRVKRGCKSPGRDIHT